MNTKTLQLQKVIQVAKVVMLALILSLGISFVQAQFSGPSQPPAGGNVDAPVNVGTSAQIKNGGLSVNEFAAFGNALFGQQVDINGNLRMGSVGNGTAITRIMPTSNGLNIDNSVTFGSGVSIDNAGSAVTAKHLRIDGMVVSGTGIAYQSLCIDPTSNNEIILCSNLGQ